MYFCLLLDMGVEIGCSLLRRKCRPRFFENRVLRRIFGPKRDERFYIYKETVEGSQLNLNTFLKLYVKRKSID